MTESEIRETVFKVLGKIAPEADLHTLDPNQNLREALDIDSFDYLQFMIALHENLAVDIPESDYPQLATLAGILRYLSAK
ncbi:MAG: acyl carrier protein [Acidobacteria bacterium]|nr:acyl carrier protein [Acidobacteriota bacterium]